MEYIYLTEQEIQDIDTLLHRILQERERIPLKELVANAHILSHALSERVKIQFYNFKLNESSLGICVKNYPIDEEKIEKTPTRYPDQAEGEYLIREEVLHILFASLLGEVIGWSTQQHGRILNEIIPIKENEGKVISSGSTVSLDFHNDDAFHPYMEDYLGWVCLRNPYKIPTVISSLNGALLESREVGLLFEVRFPVGASLAQEVELPRGKVAVLFGHRDEPYIRYNMLNIDAQVLDDENAQAVLATVTNVLHANAFDFIPEAGDFYYLDNYRAVHGRRSYTPRYDGSDRWLKRLLITSSFRQSRDLRESPASRVIHPRNGLKNHESN